jgi:hypothetical protein
MTQKNKTLPEIAQFLIFLSQREIFGKYVDRLDLERVFRNDNVCTRLMRHAVKSWRDERGINWRQALTEKKKDEDPDRTQELEYQERTYIMGRSAEDLMAEVDRAIHVIQLRDWIFSAAERSKKKEPMALAGR